MQLYHRHFLNGIPFRRNWMILERPGVRQYRDARRRLNPSFQHFIYAAQVRKLWRDIIRRTRVSHGHQGLQPDERKELLLYARYEFDVHKDETNLDKIRYFISKGRRDFHAMESAIDLSVAQFKHRDDKLREVQARRSQRPVVQLYRDETVGN